MYPISSHDTTPQYHDVGRLQFVTHTFPVGFMQCNCTIVGNVLSHEAIVVDPGGDADVILRHLEALSLSPSLVRGVYHTHGHLDHILASADLVHRLSLSPPQQRRQQQQQQKQPLLMIHADDEMWWTSLDRQAKAFGIQVAKPPAPDRWLQGGETISLGGGVEGTVLHTPGHTAGSCSYVFPDLKLVLTGDTLFKTNVGRYDLPGGDFARLEQSIRTKLYTLPGDYKVIPGHGATTTIGFERKRNFVIRAEEYETDDSDDNTSETGASSSGVKKSNMSGQGGCPHCCFLSIRSNHHHL